jgi:hypothetical protein
VEGFLLNARRVPLFHVERFVRDAPSGSRNGLFWNVTPHALRASVPRGTSKVNSAALIPHSHLRFREPLGAAVNRGSRSYFIENHALIVFQPTLAGSHLWRDSGIRVCSFGADAAQEHPLQ